MIVVVHCRNCDVAGYWYGQSNSSYRGNPCRSCNETVHVMVFKEDEYTPIHSGVNLKGNDKTFRDLRHLNNIDILPPPTSQIFYNE